MAKKNIAKVSNEEVAETEKQQKQEAKLEKKRVKKEQKQIRKQQEAEFKSNNKFVSTVKRKVWPVLVPFFVVMIFLIILPLLSMIFQAIFVPTGDDNIPNKISGKAFVDVFTSGPILASLGLSVGYAFVASLLCVIVGYPIAYIMASLKSKILAKNMWVIVTMPIWINMMIKVLGLKSFFQVIGLAGAIGTPFSIIVGMVYMFLPFAIGPMYDSIVSREIELEEAAKDLGCSSWKTFWSVTLRQTMPGILTGFSLVIIQAATSLIVVAVLGSGEGGSITLIAQIIETYFKQGTGYATGAAISVVLVILVFLIMWIINLITKSFENNGKGKNKWRNSSKSRISQ